MAAEETGTGQPNEGELAGVVARNIRALLAARRELERQRRLQQRVADAVTRFTGSMPSVYLHLLLFGGWVLINSGVLPGVEAVDPFPFVMLAMFASAEAIFLTTFVLISQNRMTDMADRRADLDLQIDLLAEHEVTRLVSLVDAIAKHLGVNHTRVGNLEELKKDVEPEKVLAEIERIKQDEKD